MSKSRVIQVVRRYYHPDNVTFVRADGRQHCYELGFLKPPRASVNRLYKMMEGWPNTHEEVGFNAYIHTFNRPTGEDNGQSSSD